MMNPINTQRTSLTNINTYGLKDSLAGPDITILRTPGLTLTTDPKSAAAAATPSLPPQVAAQLAQQLINMDDQGLYYYYSDPSKIAEFNQLPPDVARAIVQKLLRADSPDKAYFALRTLMALIKGSGSNGDFSAIFTADIQSQVKDLAQKQQPFFQDLANVAKHNDDGSYDLLVNGRMPWNSVHVESDFQRTVEAAEKDALPFSGKPPFFWSKIAAVQGDAGALAWAVAQDPAGWGLDASATPDQIIKFAQDRIQASKDTNGSLGTFANDISDAMQASQVSSGLVAPAPSSSQAQSNGSGAPAATGGAQSSPTASGSDVDPNSGKLTMTGDRTHDFAATVFNEIDDSGELSAFLEGRLDPTKYSGQGGQIAMASLQQKIDTWSNFMKMLSNILSTQSDIVKDFAQNMRA